MECAVNLVKDRMLDTTWMSIVEGFGGMRIKDNALSFEPTLPKAWQGFSFKINFRGSVLKISVDRDTTQIIRESGPECRIMCSGTPIDV